MQDYRAQEKRWIRDAEEELGRDDAECRSSDKAKPERVEPSSSKDHVKRPAASEEEEEEERTKKSRNADPAGQKRTDPEAATAPSPSKSKATEPTGETRKADSDAEDMEDTVGQGSHIKSQSG